MKQFSLPSMLAAVVFCAGSASLVHAQQRPAAPEVALIDLNYIFKNHTGFKAQKAELQSAVDMTQIDIRSRQERAKQMQAKLQEYTPGSPDFKTVETAITKEVADLNLSVQLERKRFIEREAEMAYNLYKQVLAEVTYYSRQTGIRLVLRFNGEPLDMNKPEHVIEQINRDVVYHEGTIDITPVILQRLNSQVPASATRPGIAPTR